jgi:hypothetical protein
MTEEAGTMTEVKDIHTKAERKTAGDFDRDWTRKCQVCGATPVVFASGLCGPCTWGESETAGGNW